MEQKIKVLVSNISQAVGMVLQGDYGRQGEHGPGQALTKDVAALQRLVNASVVALKSASAPGNPPSTPASANGGAQSASKSFVTSHTIAQDNYVTSQGGGGQYAPQGGSASAFNGGNSTTAPSRRPPPPPTYSGGHNPLAHRPNV